MELTAERLRALLRYEPTTGVFTWLSKTGTKRAGSVAGNPHAGDTGKVYIRIQVDRKLYRAQRLAWLYMQGVWPSGEVDHKNGDSIDNRWENLRDGDHFANMQNQRRAHSNSRTGLLGCNPHGAKYRAQIWHGGRNIHLGLFATAELAHAAYTAAKRNLHAGSAL